MGLQAAVGEQCCFDGVNSHDGCGQQKMILYLYLIFYCIFVILIYKPV